MKYPKLQIAWSVVWGIAVLFLCALWVRSYSVCDDIAHTAVEVSSVNGIVQLSILASPNQIGWDWSTIPANFVATQMPAFEFSSNATLSYCNIPYSLPVVMLTLVASAPWIPQRFTLRTLLIATTISAILLGLVTWRAKSPTTPPANVGDFGR